MKNTISFLLCIIILLGLAACDAKDTKKESNSAPRDTRRDSRAERGSLLPLEMNACLPGWPRDQCMISHLMGV